MKLVSLKYDYVFREVFSHESIRKQFISDVTGIPLETILLLLSDKGTVPKELSELILREKNSDKLDEWVKLAARADSVEEFWEKCGLQ